MKRLENLRAVITGASDGIGFGIAQAFAREGAGVWLTARDPEKLARAEKELACYDQEVRVSSVDLTDVEAVQQLGREIQTEWETLDILVNNAGMARFTPFESVPFAEIEQQVGLNVLAPYLLTQQLLPALQAAKGNVINISSSSAQRLIPGRPASVYAMTKGAINSLTKALALELGPLGIRVNAIAPGTVNTPLTQKMIASFSEERKAEYDKFVKTSFALGTLGEPMDVGEAAVYLASSAAKWVTGSVLNVDGGLTTN